MCIMALPLQSCPCRLTGMCKCRQQLPRGALQWHVSKPGSTASTAEVLQWLVFCCCQQDPGDRPSARELVHEVSDLSLDFDLSPLELPEPLYAAMVEDGEATVSSPWGGEGTDPTIACMCSCAAALCFTDLRIATAALGLIVGTACRGAALQPGGEGQRSAQRHVYLAVRLSLVTEEPPKVLPLPPARAAARASVHLQQTAVTGGWQAVPDPCHSCCAQGSSRLAAKPQRGDSAGEQRHTAHAFSMAGSTGCKRA